ncbi:LANO_0C09670g1_1 [Lachancea nothofagi CBS 11611]|uniref:Methylated-DNA--protein-cysteine methyltransferase n=1 Tax=Lachancea nothofagi CBS 11611 TaxID=1266666 RepID=A0A1G4JA87_9SACH|nr:LANO_0C09670g1_1 [Lachancea nothofagi CBS 11611]
MPEELVFTFARGQLADAILVARKCTSCLVFVNLGSDRDTMLSEIERCLNRIFRRLRTKYVLEQDTLKDLSNIRESFENLLNGYSENHICSEYLYGTNFQRAVWEQLIKIPWGKTTTYKQIAIELGTPRSFRAVANACGANPLPLVIPCHRVIGSSGSLGGFKWSLLLKHQLLSREGKVVESQSSR